jgi:hypothetical protein
MADRGRRLWALLYGRGPEWFTPFYGKRVAHDHSLRLTAVDGGKLGAIGAGSDPVLLLNPQLW